jgi:regulator of protease activity HflC (stomatin/prohibitin superfamily)
MTNAESRVAATEREVRVANGFAVLTVVIVMFLAAPALVIGGVVNRAVGLAIVGAIVFVVAAFVAGGFFTLAPNMARVLQLFGAYKGTVRDSGFHWANPFYAKRQVSLRAHNLNGEKIKVNDRAGNPIEIAAIVVWRVRDTAQAVFDVESYEQFVSVQSETAVRHLASTHPYDGGTDEEPSLRGSADVVAKELMRELQERLDRAGVEVIEARLSHLAYAPEIAGVMLRRQQAQAVIAARQKIVEGAVGMVEMALDLLAKKEVVHLDEERKATMVSNLLVVLCSEQSAQPVLNAGTLYA